MGSEELIQDQVVPDLGDIDLWESGVCDTAWATLTIDTTTYNEPGGGPLPELAEFFYEPAQGGPEQFHTAAWSLQTNQSTITGMVPYSTGSIKACGGDPTYSADPFDVDPQGANGIAEVNDNGGRARARRRYARTGSSRSAARCRARARRAGAGGPTGS